MTEPDTAPNEVVPTARRYVSFQEARRSAAPPSEVRSDEQIRADMKASVRRNAATLRTLARM